MKNPKYSIVVPVYNHFEDHDPATNGVIGTRPCIESIFKASDMDSGEVELIVVCNGCTDATGPYIQELCAKNRNVRHLWYDAALGYTKAINLGLNAARGDFLIPMNNDVVIYEGRKNQWLEILSQPIECDPTIGLTGPSKLFDENTMEWFVLFFLACFPRRMWEQFGPLDEIFNPGAGEDIDFSIKLQRAGMRILQVPYDRNFWKYHTEFPVYHKAEATVFDLPDWNDIFHRNGKIVGDRHRPRIRNLTTGDFLRMHAVDIDLFVDVNKMVDDFLYKHGKKIDMAATIKSDDRAVIATLVRKYKPRQIIETGTNVGMSTTLLALNAPEAHIRTYDIPSYNVGSRMCTNATWGELFRGTEIEARIEAIDKSTFEIDEKSLPVADMWFIDSDHGFHTVAHETKMALRNMEEKGGLIVWHDAAPVIEMYTSHVFDYVAHHQIGSSVVRTGCGVAWMIVQPKEEEARRRQYKNSTVVALMMTRNEADILPRVLQKWAAWNIPVIAIDDSDDGSFDVLRTFPNVHAYRQQDVIGKKDATGSLDWMYGWLLEKKRELYGVGQWCAIACGDEVWVNDANKIAAAAKAEGASYVRMRSLQHFLHKEDEEKWDAQNGCWKEPWASMAPEDRLPHFSWEWCEDRMFFDEGGKPKYGSTQAFDTMPSGVRTKLYSCAALIQHFAVRSPSQLEKRARDRVSRGYQMSYSGMVDANGKALWLEHWPGFEAVAIKNSSNYGWLEEQLSHLKDDAKYTTVTPVRAAAKQAEIPTAPTGPRLDIITPCSRPHHLPYIHQSIVDAWSSAPHLDIRWHIVFDGMKVPSPSGGTLDFLDKSKYFADRKWVDWDVVSVEESIFGNFQRNRGLEMADDMDAWVYFLDDDTVMCRDLLLHFSTWDHDAKDAFFLRMRRDWAGPPILTPRPGALDKHGQVDTGQMIARRRSIGDVRWENFYEADWKFLKQTSEQITAQRIEYREEQLAWYNWLAAVDVARAQWVADNVYGRRILVLNAHHGVVARILSHQNAFDVLALASHDPNNLQELQRELGHISGIEFLRADASSIPNGEWDTIIARDEIQQYPNAREITENLKKYCKRLLIMVPYREPEGWWGGSNKSIHLKELDFPSFQASFSSPKGEMSNTPPDLSSGYAPWFMALRWSNKEMWTVTAEISTRDRYNTTLPLAVTAVALQTVKPKRLIIADDGQHCDLRHDPVYQYVFALLDKSGIAWEVVFSNGTGQVANHQAAMEKADTEWIWRLDDDNIPEADCLEKLLLASDNKTGAVGGCVVDPRGCSTELPTGYNVIDQIYNGSNAQWHLTQDGKIHEVDHLYSTFIYRKSAGMPHGYCKDLSVVGHREETIFTYEMLRAGWKLLFNSAARTWHFRFPNGGIRTQADNMLWERDELVFRKLMSEWGVLVEDKVFFVLNNGMGDHVVFRMLLPELRQRHAGKKLVLAVCYTEVFEGEDVELISLADAHKIFGDLERYSVYRYMAMTGWSGPMIDAYRKMYLG